MLRPVPVGTQIQLTCRVTQGFRISWSITLPGSGALDTDIQGAPDSLARHGVIVTPTTNTSNAENPERLLRINGTEANNGTVVRCIGIELSDITNRCQNERITVVFYGTH